MPRDGVETTLAFLREATGAGRGWRPGSMAADRPTGRAARLARREAKAAMPYPTLARRARSSVALVVVVAMLGLLTAVVVGCGIAVLVFAVIRAVNS